MEIDWTKVRRVVLNNKSTRPHIGDVDDIVDYLPDAKILGFGKYGLFNHWYFIVESQLFPPYESYLLYTIDITQIKRNYPRKRMRPTPQPPMPPNKSGA